MARTRLKGVAEALGEGRRVDWATLERRSHPRDRAGLRQLRSLVELTGYPAEGRHAGSPLASGLRLPLPWAAVLFVAAGQAVLALGSFALESRRGAVPFPVLLQASAVACLLACSLVLLRFGHERRATSLALLLLLLGSAASQRFIEASAGLYPDAFLPYAAWTFTRDFPRSLRFARLDAWCDTAARLSCGAGVVLFSANVMIVWMPAAAGLLGLDILRRAGTSVYWAIVLVLMAPALGVMLRRTRDAAAAERRRVAFFLSGLVAGLLPLVLIVGLELTSGAFDRLTSQPRYLAIVDAIIYASLLSIPCTTSYSVIVRRVLAVRVVVRKTVRYALARQTLIAITALPLAVLLGWILDNRHLTVSELLGGAGTLFASGLAFAAAFLLVVRGRLLQFLDRRYFRGDVDLPGRLGAFAEALRQSRDRRHVAELIEQTIEPTLHVVRADLFQAASAAGPFVPVRGRGTALTRSSALVALMEESNRPLDLDASGLRPLLPEDDYRWVDQQQVAVLIPLVDPAGLRAFIAVGRRRNDRKFGHDGLSFLSTVAAAAALALQPNDRDEEVPAPEREPTPAAECESCRRVVGGDVSHCGCGGRLRTASLPAVLSGKFHIEALLGAGGMGLVYQAVDVSLARKVALKTLPRLSAGAAARLREEAQAMARVEDRSLATIHSIETWRGTPVLVIELLERGTLANRLLRGRLACNEAVLIALQTARCVAHLHQHGLLHRDIKPSNVGFTAARQVKVLDFGLATALDSVLREEGTDGFAGTPLYLSPEAVDGAPPAPSFDLWALAMLLFESLAGDHPFRNARSLHEALALVRKGRIPDVRTCRAECPDGIADFLQSALAQSPGLRPATAEAFIGALSAASRSSFGSDAHDAMLRNGVLDV